METSKKIARMKATIEKQKAEIKEIKAYNRELHRYITNALKDIHSMAKGYLRSL